jgi:hypothetical protein
VAFGAIVCCRASNDEGQAEVAASSDSSRQTDSYTGCVKIFDGKSFKGWEADPSTGARRWYAALVAVHDSRTRPQIMAAFVSSTARMAPMAGSLGVLFWGSVAGSFKPKIDNAGWICSPPRLRDYHPPKHRNFPHETLAKGSRDFTKWCTTELVCNLEKGTLRAAVDGVEIVRYTHPHAGERKDPEKRIVPGPIGMFRHGGGASEYKEIYLEVNPKEDKLHTVR